ncbi:MAG: type I pullulanase [Lachnospiraceae bacterium]|nr:type I pullulanase [Lachnospiraceae bacterium]
MKRKGLQKKFFSVFLAGALAVQSLASVPVMKTHAASAEGTAYSHRFYDSNYDSQYAYSGNDLGCNYTPQSTTFKVWSPEASSVVLRRFRQGNGDNLIEEKVMEKGDKGVWSITINGDIVNTYYTYNVTVNGTTKEAVDIYAKAVGVNGDRGMVVDLDRTDPANWDTNYQREKTNLSDIIVWEVHIRDFSIDASSGVSAENRGKYKAFTESTTVNGAGKTASCVEYLKQLGVTHVQILPMYDYASVDETNVSNNLSSNYNWGYDPENYNAPEGSYSSNPYDGNVRITEMKEMIQALHDAGIKVIMDVVYNHTYDSADSNLNKIMPGYYYKLNNDKSFNNQSGCGNATRSESAMYRKYMIDSLTYWAEEYNLDGFRFDLMGIHDVTTMNQIRSTLDSKFGEDTIVLYGEGWTGDGSYDSNSAHKANEERLDDGIGYFNDQIRDALKGEHKFDGTIGLVQNNYVQGSYLEEGQKWPNNVFGGIMGSVGKTDGQYGMWRPFWSKSSNCVISYVSAHDNLTLWDKLTEGFGKNYTSTDDKLIKMNKMAGSVVLTSKGGVFIQAGEEFARTKNGDDNSYASSDHVNKIDWNRVNTYSSVQKYYEGMIKIRKAFSGFRSVTTRSGDNWNPNNNNLEWINKDQNGLVAFYETNSVEGEWNRVAVLINNATSDTTVNLSKSNNWVIIADGTTAGLEKIKETGSNVTIPGKSVVVALPKDTFEACNISENKEPKILVDSSYEVAEGESLSFTAQISDPDGDSLTVNTTGMSSMSGATFNASTGTFQWTSAVAGNYTFTLTVTDGKATVTKNITVTVTEKTTVLKNLIAEIEQTGYPKIQYTDNVWTAFDNALKQAKNVVSDGERDDAKIQAAYNLLKTTYEVLKNEAQARTQLESVLEQGKTRLAIAKADAANYDVAAIEDLETVVADVTEYLKTAHEVTSYESNTDDLEDAIKACVSLKANPTIRVKASDWSSPAIYIWQGSGDGATKLAGDWPGTKLTTKDAEGWYVYELPENTTGYSLIVNDGVMNTATQTSDITGINGSVDVTVTSFSGKTCTYTKTEHEVGSGTPKVDKSHLASVVEQAEQLIQEKPDSAMISELTTSTTLAKMVYTNEEASQVEVNQAVRTLKQAIKVVQEEKELIPPNAPTDMTVTDSVGKVSDIPLSTGWEWADEDKNKSVESGSTITVTAIYTGNDKENYQNTEVEVKITKKVTTCQHKDTKIINAKEATCKQAGYEGDLYCNDCTQIIQYGAEIPTKEHQWDEGTNLGNGSVQYVCGLCTETKIETISCSFDVLVYTEEYVYDGTEKKPSVVVMDGDKVLVEDTDYFVVYQNNIDACNKEQATANSNIPTVIVKGKGNYVNATITNGTTTFSIMPRDLNMEGISISDITEEYTYTGNAIEPVITIVDSIVSIKEEDYTVSYSNHINAGTATVTITGTGNYKGVIKKTFIIRKATFPMNVPQDICVSVENKTVSNVELPANWKWLDTDKDQVIELGKTLSVTAVYEGVDKDNYENLTVTIHLTGIDCKHLDKSKYEIRGSVSATCTENGYTGDTYCADCQTKVSSGKVIEATGHQWDLGTITKEPTQTTDGEIIYTCVTCKEQKKEVIKATGGSTDETQTTQAPKEGTILTDSLSGGSYEVTLSGLTGGTVIYKKPINKNAKQVTIPATVTINGITYKVTYIGEDAFKKNKKLEKLTIQNNIEVIEENAFYGCTSLKTVTLGKDVEVISKGAFYGCKNLTKVTLDKNLVVIGDKAFYKCSKLKSITIPSKVSKIGKSAFYGCKKLMNITIKTKKLTSKKIGSNAFSKTFSSAKVKVPKTKLSAYKKFLYKKGFNKKAVVK